MKAAIFITGLCHMQEEGPSAEECLRKLQDRLRQKVAYHPRLTFRPHDGMIFCYDLSIDKPIGVLYREGYPHSRILTEDSLSGHPV